MEELLGETQNFSLWRTTDENGEVYYHLDMGIVTFHFFESEWEELVGLIMQTLPHGED